MRFWQAVVVAQMAGGAVWADRFIDRGWWAHMAADAVSLLFGALMWFGLRLAFDQPPPAPSDSLHTGEEG